MAWRLVVNHVGGYGYRLCKMPANGISELTEECFQQNHMDFVGDHQWVVFDAEPEEREEVKATRTRKGTFPLNSQWTEIPIPWKDRRTAHIFDYVEVPVHLEPGMYVLSFRWDSLNRFGMPAPTLRSYDTFVFV